MAQDMLNEQLRQAIFSVWTQSMEEAKEQDRATKERVARDLTSTILQSLLQETLAETLKTTQHQADITQAIIKTSYTISQQLMETALLTTITKLVADKRVEAALYRSTMRRWRAAYQAREAQRIEQQRRIELFRVNTTGIKLGPTRCDQLTLPLTEFHVVRDSLTTTTATTSSTADTIQENPWRPIDWTERLTQLKISDDQQSRSHLWQLSVSVEEEDKLSAAWLEAKMITRQQQQSSLDNNNSNSNDKGITYLITPEMNNSKLLDKNVEASAILFIGSDLSQVDENDTVSMSSYTLEQRERLYALSSSIPGRHIPLLMVFWAHTGSAQEVAFVHRVTDQCSRELTKKRCVILSSQESFNEFDKQIDWLIEHSSLHPIISFYELTRDFSDVFRWTCRRVNQFETTWLLPFSTSSSTTITTASNIRSDQHRKRSTSFTDAVLRHTIDYVNLLIELFNSYLITLEQLISSYLLNDQQMNNHEFFNQLKIAPTYELLTLQMTAQRLLASIHWIPPAMTLSCNAELMLSQLFRELEVIVLSLIEQHTTSYNALIYMHSTQQQELLSNFRLKAQHILDRIERDFRILPQTSEITKKPRRITTQSSLSQLRSLVHDVQDWLHQSESS
ncbi:hypothetical protein BDF19DRAFT_240388 [Syncephalis fuscata]|nr:hypothetical protein BDF19DRAFT_240388 [Syncephalis fuscata]